MSEATLSGVTPIPDSQMVAVPKEFFFEGMPLPVPVYLRMKVDSYLVIGKHREKVNFTNFHSYKNQDTRVYVRKEDQQILIQFATTVTERMVNQKNVPSSVKGKFLGGLIEDAFESFEDKGVASVAQVERVSKFLLEVTTTVSYFDEVLGLISQLPNEESKHAMATCMISLMIADEMELNLKAAQEKLALGSLLHDIGLKMVPKTILEKPKHLWTMEEQAIYEQHPLRAVEMLRDLKDISNDVLLIIAEHHETAVGTGFPKRIRDVKISPLGRIVILADYFADLLYARHAGGKDYKADEAIQYIEEIMGQPFNKQVFSALKTVINKKNLADKAAA